MKYKRFFSLIALFLACTMGGTLSAFAGEIPTVTTSSCKIEKSRVAELQTIQENANLGYLDAIKQELRVRQSLLHDIVSCATDDAVALKAQLDALHTTDPAALAVQQRLSDALGDAIRHYQTAGDTIDSLALGGSKTLANDLESWRANTYIPLETRASKFVLWQKNSDLIAAAQNRLNQIGLTIKVLKLIGSDEISALFDKAKSNLDTATANSVRSFQILSDFNSTEDPLPYEKNSLSLLSDTYNNFLDLSTLVQKVLPH
jgi:hypothetical protein